MRKKKRRRIRAKTIAVKRLSKEQLRIGMILHPAPLRDHWRPMTRADCAMVERPCPFVACQFNLYLDVNPDTGSIKLNFPDLEPWEMKESCALDIADRGGETLEATGEHMNLTRERIRQIELDAVRRVRAVAMSYGLHEFADNILPGDGEETMINPFPNMLKRRRIKIRSEDAYGACVQKLDRRIDFRQPR